MGKGSAIVLTRLQRKSPREGSYARAQERLVKFVDRAHDHWFPEYASGKARVAESSAGRRDARSLAQPS
jgi:hypothetical protein